MSIDDERKHISNLLKDTQALEVSTGVFKQPLPAGIALDALVAEKVMGWTTLDKCTWLSGDVKTFDHVEKNTWVHPLLGVTRAPPEYSTDIGAAFTIIEKLREHCCCINLRFPTSEDPECELIKFAEYTTESHGPKYYATAPTMPHAICLAAVKAMGAK